MLRKLMVAQSVVALGLAACTQGAPDDAADRPVPRETLLLSTQAGPLVVQIPSGSVLFDRPRTVASLGGSWLLSATPSAGSTLLETVDGADAESASDVSLDGTLDVRVVSESGAAVALTDPLPDGWDPEVPLPRSRTPIVVADPTGAEQPRTYDLRGNFEPEAFSTDDRQLFMIQHLPAERRPCTASPSWTSSEDGSTRCSGRTRPRPSGCRASASSRSSRPTTTSCTRSIRVPAPVRAAPRPRSRMTRRCRSSTS
jgi:hypothetical protein